MAAQDKTYQHMAKMEGNENTGYIPKGSAESGVTIGMGVDLLWQTSAGLKQKGVPEAIVRKIDKCNFYGKNRAQIEAEGLKPGSLVLSNDELEQLNEPFIKEARDTATEYGGKMDDKGRACLASLRHWAGRLGNSNPGKLARQLPDGSVVNYVWNAIKDKKATTAELLRALQDTLKTYDKAKTPLNHRTIEREINYLSGLPY